MPEELEIETGTDISRDTITYDGAGCSKPAAANNADWWFVCFSLFWGYGLVLLWHANVIHQHNQAWLKILRYQPPQTQKVGINLKLINSVDMPYSNVYFWATFIKQTYRILQEWWNGGVAAAAWRSRPDTLHSESECHRTPAWYPHPLQVYRR